MKFSGIGIMLLLAISAGPVSIFSATPVHAQATSTPGANWDAAFANLQGTDSSAQTQITSSNVNNLQIAWTFPFPAAAGVLKSLLALPQFGIQPGATSSPTQGPGTPPLVHDGIVYEMTNNYDVYAFNAGTGQVVWHYVPPLANEVFAQHVHAITYYHGMIWLTVPGHGYVDVLGLDALVGDLKVNITDIAKGVTGQRYEPLNGVYTPDVNKWFYDPEWPPVFYKNIMMTMSDDPDAITRGFNSAYDITTGKLLWTWYAVPPAPNCDPNWDFENLVVLGNGTTVNYGQPKGNITPYRGDWGTDCNINGGGGIVFSPAVDNQTGVVYGTNLGAYPAGYGGGRPGPDLYGGAIVALNMTNGKMLWYYEPDPHDMVGDQDCEWGTVLTVVNGVKQVVAECHYYIYGLDAATGKLLWSYDPLNNKATGTNPTQYPGIGYNMGNQMNMTMAYPFYPSGKYLVNATVSENLPAWDGKNTIFAWSDINTLGAALPVNCAMGPPTNTTLVPFRWFDTPVGFQWCSPPATLPQWGTVVAIDQTTGNIEWSHTYPNVLQRGGLTYTNGMLIVGTNDGNLRVYNAVTGNLLMSRHMGIALNYSPTIGATADGKIMMFLPVGGGILFGAAPGFLAAFSLVTPSSGGTTSGGTVTATTTVTGEGGVSSTLFYGVAAVAVIFIIVSGALAMRGRRPVAS